MPKGWIISVVPTGNYLSKFPFIFWNAQSASGTSVASFYVGYEQHSFSSHLYKERSAFLIGSPHYDGQSSLKSPHVYFPGFIS